MTLCDGSWLLRDPNMKLRTSYEPYLEVADRYLSRVIDQVRDLQFTLGDGPIIAFQVPRRAHSAPRTEFQNS